MIETTEEEFATFQESFEAFKAWFGLVDFSTYFEHGTENTTAAQIAIDIEGRSAGGALCKEYPEIMQAEGNIEDWARHEALHLLLADFGAVLKDPTLPESIKRTTEEALVTRLEHILDTLA